MKFRMITTFFGRTASVATPRTSIGSARRFAARGHEVHVYYCVDAFNAVRGDHPLRDRTRHRRAFTFTP